VRSMAMSRFTRSTRKENASCEMRAYARLVMGVAATCGRPSSSRVAGFHDRAPGAGAEFVKRALP